MALPGFGWTAPQPKSDMVPLDIQRRTRKQDRQDALEAAYAIVDKRDGLRCWITGTLLQRSGVGAAGLLTRHHLDERSTSPERRADPDNIISVSLLAHRLITCGWIIVEGTDARRRVGFHWREGITPRMRPFVIKSRKRIEWKAGE